MTLEAGVSVQDICPVKSLHLFGYPHVERNSTGIHDPILASSLCLRNEKTSIILVAVDIGIIDTQTANELRVAIAGSVRIPESHVFISCTHTHSAPLVADYLMLGHDPVIPEPDSEYKDLFVQRIMQASLESATRMQPAEYAFTTAEAVGVGGNRHDPQGVADPEVGIIALRHIADKRMVALSLTYSMHPTVLHEDSTLVSSDFPGYTRLHLAERLRENVVILYHTGPSGNQSPRYFVKGQTFAEAERLGRMLGEKICSALERLCDADFLTDVSLSGKMKEVSLTPRCFPSPDKARAHLEKCVVEYERLKKEQAGHGPIRTAECAVFGAEHTVSLAELQARGEIGKFLKKCLPARAQVLRIGDCFLAGLSGEFFVEYGLEIKSRSPRTVFPVSLVNGNLQGYVVTEEAYATGGYEAGAAMFPPEAGRTVVDAVLQMIR